MDVTATVIFVLLLFFGTVALAVGNAAGTAAWWWLIPFSAGGLALLGFWVYRMFREGSEIILYEAGIYFALACSIYYLFGPLLYVAAPDAALQDSRLLIYPEDGLWITGMNLVGIGVTGLTYVVLKLPGIERTASQVSTSWSKTTPTRAFLYFTVAGLISRYLVVIPYDFGFTTAVPAGIFRQLQQLLVVALIIGWAHHREGPRWMLPVSIVLLVLGITTSILLFNKLETLFTIGAFTLGNYSARGRARRTAVSVIVALSVYVLITPIVTFGRNELAYRHRGAAAGFAERVDIVEQYFSGGESHERQEASSLQWWFRLNYLPTQRAAVDFYDAGMGGEDAALIPWLVVPRLVYPGKPDMSSSGPGLNEKFAGSRTSSMSAGIFIDGYYNKGWFGLVFAALSYGFLLRLCATISKPIVQSRAILLYPLTFIGITAGLRADAGWLGVAGGSFVVISMSLALLGALSGTRARMRPLAHRMSR